MFKELESAALNTTRPLEDVLKLLRYNDEGLIPAIAQDARSNAVLMLAWMNRESIQRTLRDGYACYWSRSRSQFWRKGETSGNLQRLVQMHFDCDGDAILLSVEQSGPACHTNRPSCFYLEVSNGEVRVTSEPV